jgi:SAM-dependent methyltransferase
MSDLDSIVCPYCNGSPCDKEYDLTWKDERFPEYHVAFCKQCYVGFVLPLPTPAQLNTLYNSIQYHSKDRATANYSEEAQEVIDARIKLDGNIVNKYHPYVPSEGRVLDIGSGWGTLLKYFDRRGFETVGLELSKPTSDFARNILGLKIYNLPVEDVSEIPESCFDLITMRHVLEHFYDPSSVLLSLREKLSDNGKVIIEVPDYGSFDRRSFGTQWPAFGPYHLWYFTKQSLIRFLDDTGFEVLHFHTFLSERAIRGNSIFAKLGRKALNRIGGKRLFSGRSIGLIARKKAEPNSPTS